MVEIITIGEQQYISKNIVTGVDSISFDVNGLTLDEAKSIFKDVTSLTISNDDGVVYGKYPDIKYSSITEFEDGTITVNMHILSDIERQLRDLHKSQLEQDEVITEILFGGNNE